MLCADIHNWYFWILQRICLISGILDRVFIFPEKNSILEMEWSENLLRKPEFRDNFIRYYLTYLLCITTLIILKDCYIWLQVYSYTRRTFYYSVDSITYWFYLLHKFKMSSTFSGKFQNNCSVNRNFPEHYSVTFRNSRTTSRKFPVYGKKPFRNSGFPEPFP